MTDVDVIVIPFFSFVTPLAHPFSDGEPARLSAHLTEGFRLLFPGDVKLPLLLAQAFLWTDLIAPVSEERVHVVLDAFELLVGVFKFWQSLHLPLKPYFYADVRALFELFVQASVGQGVGPVFDLVLEIPPSPVVVLTQSHGDGLVVTPGHVALVYGYFTRRHRFSFLVFLHFKSVL